MTDIFVTADQHFDHANIVSHTNRPFENVQEMNEALLNNWNSVVKPKDLVYVVGDFAWRNHGKWINVTNGKKILIRGTHDKMNQAMLCQFRAIHDLLQTSINGQEVVFCHYAMKTWRGSYRGAWHLYGHSHGRIEECEYVKSCDVGVDVWGFYPVPWEAIKRKFADKLPRTPFTEQDDFERDERIAKLIGKNRYYLKGAGYAI